MNRIRSTAAPHPEQLDYLLRRAEQESIAAIRSLDSRAAESHERMAGVYSERVLAMLSAEPIRPTAAGAGFRSAS